MELFETKTIIIKWIRSCDTSEQVDLLQPFINGYIVPNFEKEIEEMKSDTDKRVLKYDLETTKIELSEAIEERKLIISTGADKPNAKKYNIYDDYDDPDGIHNSWW